MHRKLGSVLAYKDELNRWVEQRCSLEKKKPPATTLPVYELYLKGRQLFRQFRRRNFERAREMFARAIELDPKLPRPTQGSPTAVLISISIGKQLGKTWKPQTRPAAKL
jgi:hypothetical protein